MTDGITTAEVRNQENFLDCGGDTISFIDKGFFYGARNICISIMAEVRGTLRGRGLDFRHEGYRI